MEAIGKNSRANAEIAVKKIVAVATTADIFIFAFILCSVVGFGSKIIFC